MLALLAVGLPLLTSGVLAWQARQIASTATSLFRRLRQLSSQEAGRKPAQTSNSM